MSKRRKRLNMLDFLKRLALIVSFCLLVRALSDIGAGELLEDALKNIAGSEKLVEGALSIELGVLPENKVPVNEEIRVIPETVNFSSVIEETKPEAQKEIGIQPEAEEEAIIFSAESVEIKNRTSYEVDVQALLDEQLKIDLENLEVLIVHTHGSEAYTMESMNVYEPSDPYRTEDRSYSVIKVGDELTACLEEKGFTVIHDREIYDYPSYTGSYSRSMEATENYLEQSDKVQIVIDLHRDALEGENGEVYKTTAMTEGKETAQLMFVIGTGENGLPHPEWKENLKLAVKLQAQMQQDFPGLVRPIDLVKERYNQHLTAGSVILEVGCSGNTLPEALSAVRLFAESFAKLLSSAE